MGENSNGRRQEQRLTRGIRALIGKGAADYAPEDWRSLREQMRLSLLYPGRYVAFRDHFRGEGEDQRLVRREVVCEAESLEEVSRLLEALPQDERMGICIDYVEPAEAP